MEAGLGIRAIADQEQEFREIRPGRKITNWRLYHDFVRFYNKNVLA